MTFGHDKPFASVPCGAPFRARTARDKPVVAPDARRTDGRKWVSTGEYHPHANVFPPLLAAFPAAGVPMVSDMLLTHHDSAVGKDRLSGNKSHPVSQTPPPPPPPPLLLPPFPHRTSVAAAAPTYENHPADDHSENDTQQPGNQSKIIGKEVRVRDDDTRPGGTRGNRVFFVRF